jgi:hypothetical protein
MMIVKKRLCLFQKMEDNQIGTDFLQAKCQHHVLQFTIHTLKLRYADPEC